MSQSPLDKLRANPRNPRTITPEKAAMLRDSLEKFGDLGGIVVNVAPGSGQIVGGHQRVVAFRQASHVEEHIEKRYAEPTKTGTVAEGYLLVDGERFSYRHVHWDAHTEIAANLSANKQAGEFDYAEVDKMLRELDSADFAIDLTMFASEERNVVYTASSETAATTNGEHSNANAADFTEFDECEENIAIPRMSSRKVGEIYILGEHRLMCGDSTNASHVASLMDSYRATLCFTSPPYGQQRDYKSKITDWQTLMSGVFKLCPMKDDGQILVNLGLIHKECEWLAYWTEWLQSMSDQGWRKFGLYIWDQGPGMPGDWGGRLAPAYELIFHFNRQAVKVNKTKDCSMAGQPRSGAGMRSADGLVGVWSHKGAKIQNKKIPDNVIRAMRHKGTTGGHPAPFSVALCKEIIEPFSKVGDILYEPFCGSGTLLLAAERLQRKAYCMEVEPTYCDIIVERWEKMTGRKATKL